MREALIEAEKAYYAGEVPIGAVVVYEDQVIGRGHNMTESLKDPTAHAEILAIRQACKKRGGWRLNGAELYVTVEPCAMCAGAMVWARISRVFYGIRDPKAGACRSIFSITQEPGLNHNVEVIEGLLEEDCRRIIKDFFKQLREKKKELSEGKK